MAQSVPAPVASTTTAAMETDATTTATDTPSIKRERSPTVETPAPKRAKTEKASSTVIKRSVQLTLTMYEITDIDFLLWMQ